MVFISAWAELANAKYLLDIGTGTGLLALMAKQRAPMAKVVAIEVDAEAMRDASLTLQIVLDLKFVYIMVPYSLFNQHSPLM